MYLVPSWLNDKARFVNEAITAKKVAFKFAGALFAIQASIGIIEIGPAEWAARLDTIAYEVVCGLGARVERRYGRP